MDWLIELDTVTHSCLNEVAAEGLLQIEAVRKDARGVPRIEIRGSSFWLEISLHHGELEGYVRPSESSVGGAIEFRCLVGALLGSLPAASNRRGIMAGLARCAGEIESAARDSDRWTELAACADKICDPGTGPDSRGQDALM